MTNERDVLEAEVFELTEILASLPQKRLIQRMSFQSRLDQAQRRLQSLSAVVSVEQATLTFRGRPVFGSHGIAADFASKATAAFTDAFAAVVAGLNDSLSYMGPITDRAKNQLIITGTAQGSFGFVLELPAPQPMSNLQLFSPDKGSEAVEKIQSLLRVSAGGTDDEVSELVEDIHPRAVKKVAEFLGVLEQNYAWCGLEFKDKFFRFDSIEQLQSSTSRLQESNIQERVSIFEGHFQGILPTSRIFEFKLVDGRIIKGKLDLAVGDLQEVIRDYLGKFIKVEMEIFQVGQGRPRYALTNISKITFLE